MKFDLVVLGLDGEYVTSVNDLSEDQAKAIVADWSIAKNLATLVLWPTSLRRPAFFCELASTMPSRFDAPSFFRPPSNARLSR